jgi:AmmeMemoRadiSam system protein A
MYKTQTIFTEIALKAIVHYLKSKTYLKEGCLSELAEPRACFVTLRAADGKLRGCIGTLSPIRENLQEEIIRNAVSAAIHDSRFSPLTIEEIDNISLSVEVLSVPEPVLDLKLLNPKKYGLIISDLYGRRGVLLPDIDGVDTTEEQIRIVKQKAGIYSDKDLNYSRFETVKYR